MCNQFRKEKLSDNSDLENTQFMQKVTSKSQKLQ